jgi:hypothetical protein
LGPAILEIFRGKKKISIFWFPKVWGKKESASKFSKKSAVKSRSLFFRDEVPTFF